MAGIPADQSGIGRAVEVPAQDENTTIRIATERLDDRFDEVPRREIEATVRRRLRELAARSRVHSFLGIIAERQARAELEDRMARANR
jgi:hypothetical protein